MSLIRLLQEASTLDLSSLKKAMQKDPRIAGIFKKDFKVEDIEDKDAFLATMKYWFFNNSNVQAFVNMRNNVKDASKSLNDDYRKMRAAQLDQRQLEVMKDVVADVFKEHKSVERATLSPALKKELSEWMNKSGYYHNLSVWAQKELMSIPSLRPSKRIMIYRGVLFNESSLSERETYDGTLEVGNGLKFLRSIKKGTREVDLSWDRPSSWSHSKEVASRFAQFGPSSSSFAATLQWLERSSNKKHIDGQVGYVISTFANPEDILIDTAEYQKALGSVHSDESEIILKAGTYKAYISKKYTVEKGEVDPSEKEEDGNPETTKALEDVKKFAASFKLPENTDELTDFSTNVWSDALPLLRDIPRFKKLLTDGTTTAALHAYEQILEMYKKDLAHLTKEHLAADKFARDAELGRKVKALKTFVESMSQKTSHAKFSKQPRSAGPQHELSPEEYRTTNNPFDIRELEKELHTQGRVTERATARNFTAIADALKVDYPTSASFAQFGAAKQEPVIQAVIDAFYKKLDIDKPAEKSEALKRMFNFIRKGYRNYKLLDYAKTLKNYLDKINE